MASSAGHEPGREITLWVSNPFPQPLGHDEPTNNALINMFLAEAAWIA